MSKVIESIERNSFNYVMNLTEEGLKVPVYAIKMLPDGSRWVVCPWCGKRQIKVLSDTKMYHVPWKCKRSYCRKEFIIN